MLRGLVLLSASLSCYFVVCTLSERKATRLLNAKMVSWTATSNKPVVGRSEDTAMNLLLQVGRPLSKLLTHRLMLRVVINSEHVVRLLRSANLDEVLDSRDIAQMGMGGAIIATFAILPSVLSLGEWGFVLLAAGMFAGVRVPYLILTARSSARRNAIKRAMLDAVDLMAVGVGAGMRLDRVMRVYSERFDNPLAEDFKKAFTRLDLGVGKREVLLDMAERADVDDLKLLVSSVLQADKLGTPIAAILMGLSQDIKVRHRQWAREMSAKAPVKMLFPLTGLILPALFIVLLGPVALRLFEG